MTETIERIGAARCRADDIPVLFHRVRVKLSRKFRVFRFPDERGILLDPSEFCEKYEQFESFKPEAGGGGA